MFKSFKHNCSANWMPTVAIDTWLKVVVPELVKEHAAAWKGTVDSNTGIVLPDYMKIADAFGYEKYQIKSWS